MNSKEAKIQVQPRESLTALMMFFVQALALDCKVDFAYQKRQGGEPFSVNSDFTVYTVYPPGLYLALTIGDDEFTTTLFKKYKPFLNSYFETEEDDEVHTYTFRLTDNLGNIPGERGVE